MSTNKSKEYHCPGLNCGIGTFKTAAALARHANNSEECGVEYETSRKFMAKNGCTDCIKCFKWFTTGGNAVTKIHSSGMTPKARQDKH